MKAYRWTALFLSLLLLTGCSSSGEYYTEEIHDTKEQAELSLGSSDISGYYTLKGAILNMVSQGTAEDGFRIGSYSGDLDSDLKSVVQEITLEEPIGIYGVASINYDLARVLTYQELSVSIQYKQPANMLRSVVQINSSYDLQSRLVQLMQSYEDRGVFRVADGTRLQESINREVYSAWMNCGAEAQGLDYVAADFYPEDQDACILELDPAYLLTDEERISRTAAVRQQATALAGGLDGMTLIDQLEYIRQWMQEGVVYDTSARRVINETLGGQRKSSIYTSYGVFMEGVAAQSGFVLAAATMLEELEVEHTVRTGMVGEDIYSWIELEIGEQIYIYDITAAQNGREISLYTDEQAAELFVSW